MVSPATVSESPREGKAVCTHVHEHTCSLSPCVSLWLADLLDKGYSGSCRLRPSRPAGPSAVLEGFNGTTWLFLTLHKCL